MHLPDSYTSKARIAPVLIVTAPIAVYTVTAITLTIRLAFGSALIGAALLVLVSQLGRDAGKRLEPQLFKRWGGRPTEQMLRWSVNDPAVVVQRHADVGAATGQKLPTAAEEQADPRGADARYQQATAALREDTRNANVFPLVAAENANYGFRRNLLGLRRFGIAISILVIVASAVTYLLKDEDKDRLAACSVPAACGLILLLIYLTVVTSEWPKTPAFGYAERLIGAAGALSRRQQSQGTETP